jgi:hypothetical protein
MSKIAILNKKEFTQFCLVCAVYFAAKSTTINHKM